MEHMQSRAGLLVGLVAAGSAFAAAVTLSAAGAPTARADDFTDVINVVDADLMVGQTDFSNALLDFSSAEIPNGLATLFSGTDTDLLGVPEDLLVGTTAVLTGQSVPGGLSFAIAAPTSFADAVSAAQNAVTTGEGFLNEAATLFGGGEYLSGLYDSAVGSDYLALPLEYFFIGSVEALGL
jgi:hypothetical protein